MLCDIFAGWRPFECERAIIGIYVEIFVAWYRQLGLQFGVCHINHEAIEQWSLVLDPFGVGISRSLILARGDSEDHLFVAVADSEKGHQHCGILCRTDLFGTRHRLMYHFAVETHGDGP